MMTLEEKIARLEYFAKLCEQNGMHEWKEEHEQFAAWLRELVELRKAPKVIFCKDCAKHNKSYGDNGAIDSCPLVLYRGKAQGHEFDYQYCAFAERRTDGKKQSD